jgi:hypothetical protein
LDKRGITWITVEDSEEKKKKNQSEKKGEEKSKEKGEDKSGKKSWFSWS